jgi:Zn-dependent peptidase ImmA (M78 family)/DNA-binding XRE family transcriptional regulator
MSQGSFSITVSPAVLAWARQAAGQNISSVAERLRVTEQTVREWESGKKPLSWTALRRLAGAYQRPVAALLLPEPPRAPEVPPDYRTIPAKRKTLSPSTLLAIRSARWLQSRAIEMRRELQIETAFRATSNQLPKNPEALAEKARRTLGVEMAQQCEWKDSHEAYRQWRQSLEEQGVLVFQFAFPVEEVRGFSLFDRLCPVVVVNESDDPTARIFTLLHEYGHLLLQEPGICLPQEAATSDEQSVETFCNRFAASVLIPSGQLSTWERTVGSEVQIRQMARSYSVSKYVVLYRLGHAGRLPRAAVRSIEKRWKEMDASKRISKRARRGGGASTEKICRRRRGNAFIQLVQQAEKRGVITTHDAVTYLGVKLIDLKKLKSA